MLPPDEVPVMREDDGLIDAFAKLGKADRRRGVVVRHGRLVGVLSLSDIERVLAERPASTAAAPRHDPRAQAS